jgi:hypothetical protein
MEGLYLYCVRKRIDIPFPFSTKGIDEKHEIRTFTYQDLEAVVSEVSLEDFDSEAIQIKAQNDLNWIKEKALIHEKVIEEAMRKDGKILNLIPMKFGMIFKEERSLKKALDESYERFKAILKRLEGKQEWSIKVYLVDIKKFEQGIKEENEKIQEKEKEIASLPEGMAFFMEEELKEVVSQVTDEELNNIVDTLFESLKKHTSNSVKNKTLGKELTGRKERMVLNASYLIPEEKIRDFKKETEYLNQIMQTKGFSLEYSGPWPAYNFTSD